MCMYMIFTGTFSYHQMSDLGILSKLNTNTGKEIRYIPMRKETRDMLYSFYKPYNQLLYNEINLTWEKEPYSQYFSRLQKLYSSIKFQIKRYILCTNIVFLLVFHNMTCRAKNCCTFGMPANSTHYIFVYILTWFILLKVH